MKQKTPMKQNKTRNEKQKNPHKSNLKQTIKQITLYDIMNQIDFAKSSNRYADKGFAHRWR